uniref:Transcriptional regulator, LytR/AlgR family n=1 Tax=mine drainage metagenome TaxID=410659 RepID=E6Q050_9ZZZZ
MASPTPLTTENASQNSTLFTAPFRALIIDDEALAREELRFLLDSTGDVQILAEAANGIEAVELITIHQPDVLFLDVQMPGLDGFTLLRHLIDHQLVERMPQIVFATAFDQYAVRAFDVNAVDYLLKPFDQGRVLQAVERTRSRLIEIDSGSRAKEPDMAMLLELLSRNQSAPARSVSSKLIVQVQSRMLLVDQAEICFASIEEGDIRIVTPAIEGHSKCRTLEDLLDLLDPNLFWRAHRGFVVNINHIREVVPWFKSSYQLRMDDRNKTEIPVSRAQTRRLRELFRL